jgi:hypothetical protein
LPNALKQRCTRAPFKTIARDINEDARNHARSLKGTPEFERSSNARKKVEMRFAHLKVQHGFERSRSRTDRRWRRCLIARTLSRNSFFHRQPICSCFGLIFSGLPAAVSHVNGRQFRSGPSGYRSLMS